MTLQTQGVLRLGVEDHLASSRTNGESRSIRPLPHIIQKPTEIFGVFMRIRMELKYPRAPPVFEISQDWVVAQSLYQLSSKPTQLRLQCQLPAAQGP